MTSNVIAGEEILQDIETRDQEKFIYKYKQNDQNYITNEENIKGKLDESIFISFFFFISMSLKLKFIHKIF